MDLQAASAGEILTDRVNVVWRWHPIRDDSERHEVPAGQTVAEIVDAICRVDGQPVNPEVIRCWVDGRRVEREDWDRTFPAQDLQLVHAPGPFALPLIPTLAAALGAAFVPASGFVIGGVAISAAVAGGIITAVCAIRPAGIGIILKETTVEHFRTRGAP